MVDIYGLLEIASQLFDQNDRLLLEVIQELKAIKQQIVNLDNPSDPVGEGAEVPLPSILDETEAAKAATNCPPH